MLRVVAILSLVSYIIMAIESLIGFIVSLLPTMNVDAIINSLGINQISSILGWVNYFVPLSQMLSLFSVWLVGMLAYQLYRFVLSILRL